MITDPILMNRILILEMMSMDTKVLIGLFTIISGLVLLFTSGAFSMVSISIGLIFQSVGIILVYIGIAVVLWNVLSSLNIYLEKFVKRREV